MKRDLDLARQLLFDIESHGPHCALSTLRAGTSEAADENIRYHLRLLIDAQLVKEIDRTNTGVPCVRLTNAGHELLELVRSDARWHDARRAVAAGSGGESLTVIRAVLTKWSIEDATLEDRSPYRRRPVYHRIERPRRYAAYLSDRELLDGERAEYYRTRPDYRLRRDWSDWRERFDWRDAQEREVYYARNVEPADLERPLDETALGVSLPVYMI